MNTTPLHTQTLALAALYQCAHLVHAVATTGKCAKGDFTALVEPLFITETRDVADILPPAHFQTGLKALNHYLHNGKLDQAAAQCHYYALYLQKIAQLFIKSGHADTMLGRLIAWRDALDTVGEDAPLAADDDQEGSRNDERDDELNSNADEYEDYDDDDDTDDDDDEHDERDELYQSESHKGVLTHAARLQDAMALCADLYSTYISNLSTRIIVRGKDSHLKNPANAEKVRTLLLAGVRIAVLYRQLGGRPYHAWLKQRAILNTIPDWQSAQ